jgi:hypothetical protein
MSPAPSAAQLEDLRARLGRLAMVKQTAGLTEPDPDTPEERWDAPQVWAHIAEFVGYWHRQIASVVAGYHGEPVPFGRTKSDAGRIGAIEVGRHRPVRELATEVDREIVDFEVFLATLSEQAWQARGLHPTRGILDVSAMIERFVTAHLAEHAAQLEGLAAVN